MESTASAQAHSESILDTDDAHQNGRPKRACNLVKGEDAETGGPEKKRKTYKEQPLSDDERAYVIGIEKELKNTRTQLTKAKNKIDGLQALNAQLESNARTRSIATNREISMNRETVTTHRKATTPPVTKTIGISALDHSFLQAEAKKIIEKAKSWARKWSGSKDEVRVLTHGQALKVVQSLSSKPKIAYDTDAAAAVLDHELGASIIVEAFLCHRICGEILMKPFRFFNGLCETLPNPEPVLQALFDFTERVNPGKACMWRSMLIECIRVRELPVQGSKPKWRLDIERVINSVCRQEERSLLSDADTLLKQGNPEVIRKRDEALHRLFKQAVDLSICIFSQGQKVKCFAWNDIHQKTFNLDSEDSAVHATMLMYKGSEYDLQLLEGCKVDFLVCPQLSLFGQDDGSCFDTESRSLVKSCLWFRQKPPSADSIRFETECSSITIPDTRSTVFVDVDVGPKNDHKQDKPHPLGIVKEPVAEPFVHCDNADQGKTQPNEYLRDRGYGPSQSVERDSTFEYAQVTINSPDKLAKQLAESSSLSTTASEQPYPAQPSPKFQFLGEQLKTESDAQREKRLSQGTRCDNLATEHGTDLNPILIQGDFFQQEHLVGEEDPGWKTEALEVAKLSTPGCEPGAGEEIGPFLQ